jgi:hypothetical protein
MASRSTAPIRNAPAELPTALRFMAARLAHRLRGSNQPASNGSRPAVDAVLARLGGHVAAHRLSRVTADDRTRWIETGLKVEPGAQITLFASGALYLSRLFDVRFGPTLSLWYRIGSGAIAKVTDDVHSFQADGGGLLRLAAMPPGAWADEQGGFDPEYGRAGVSGALDVTAVMWKTSPCEGLGAAANIAPALSRLSEEGLAALRDHASLPPGWRAKWQVGATKVYRCNLRNGQTDGQTGHDIRCRTHGNAGIIQFPVDLPLTEDSRLSWSWKVDALPSELPEHIQPTHDYLSIAVEFENGLDLTYMWSCELPVDTIFQCPLPWWDKRETHWVVRSGAADLGRWCADERSIRADYLQAIGGPPPRRLVAVWLIANSIFQGGEGVCAYRAISVRDGEQRVAVCP